MRINVGCGEKRIPGYTGVDVVARGAADIVAPADKIPLPNSVADEILGVHILEHFYQWEALDAIIEWKRLLKPGGKLVLELPNLKNCMENILSGFTKEGKHPDQMGWWGLFGDWRTRDKYMSHKFGYTPESLKDLLSNNGFINIEECPTQFHRTGKNDRDMRIEATRA